MYKKYISNSEILSDNLSNIPFIAQEILKYFKIDVTTCIPIVDILIKMGFKVYQSDLESDKISAYIIIDPEYKDIFDANKIICVNVKDNIRIKRFALAYELAHYLFDYNEKDMYFFDSFLYSTDMVEKKLEDKRAKLFVSYFLVPEDAFKDKYKEYKNLVSSVDIINELCRFFSVPTTVILKRFQELNIK